MGYGRFEWVEFIVMSALLFFIAGYLLWLGGHPFVYFVAGITIYFGISTAVSAIVRFKNRKEK